MRQALVPAAVGLAAGLVVSAVAGRWLERQLFGSPAIDVPTYLAVAGGVLVLVCLACLLPARRALRVHPITALRAT
jgi:ABC-type lipoprotein release transport system permease subunit